MQEHSLVRLRAVASGSHRRAPERPGGSGMGFRRGFGLLIAVVTTAGSLAAATAASASTAESMAHFPGSFLPINATKTSQMSASQMSVEVVLQPGNAKGLSSLLDGLYTKGSADYGHWL